MVWISLGRQAEGTPDLLPAMPGLAGLADVVAGHAFGGELDAARGAGTGEGLDVTYGGFVVASEQRPGDSLCTGVAGEPHRFATGNSMLTSIHALLSDPQACYQDLRPGYYEQRMHAHRQARNHVKGLQRLGYQVTIQPVDPDTGEILATAG
jgi:hypothetical protein